MSTASHAPQFHALEIAGVRELTPDSAEITFAVPHQLRSEYAHQPGQHITIRMHIDGEDVRRTYSLTDDTDSGVLRIGVRAVPEGRISTRLCTPTIVGTQVDVMTPGGRFIAHPSAEQSRHWLLVAAGSGITPLLAIARAVLREEPDSFVTLLFANRTTRSIMFLDDLEDLRNAYLTRLRVVHFLTRESRGTPAFDTRLTGDHVRTLVNAGALTLAEVRDAWLCGPHEMVVDVAEALHELGIANTHIELFETGDEDRSSATSPATTSEIEERETVCTASIRLAGVHARVPIAQGETVLAAARRAGLDAPFACTGGVCATCRAHLDEGAVELKANWALEESEVNAGYTLTCQALPTTPTLTVDYDRR